ncbi:unnamed protein product, partial [marine sediment metagenome]
IVIVGIALLWHVLACTESPMAFSPDGQNLAFVIMEKQEGGNESIADKTTFKLMVLSGGKQIRTIENTSKYILTGPAYSPDGKSICYLRIPLVAKEDAKERKQRFEMRAKKLNEIETAAQKDLPKLVIKSDSNPQSKVTTTDLDLTLPPANTIYEAMKSMLLAAQLSATLVVRDSQAYDIVSLTEIKLPVFAQPNEELWFTYLATRLQYSPDSQWIYVPANNLIQAVNSETQEIRILAAPVAVRLEKSFITVAILSPDGKTIAALIGNDKPIVAFFQTDGQVVTYRKLDFKPSFAGMAWKDSDTLALLSPDKDKKNSEKTRLNFIRSDGTILEPLLLQLPQHPSSDQDEFITTELALAPNGKHMVISFGKDVFFLTTEGRVLKHQHSTDESKLVQPTFTPDSTQVAFKSFIEKNDSRIYTIVFFTCRGEEISRINIPQMPRGKSVQSVIEKPSFIPQKSTFDPETN